MALEPYRNDVAIGSKSRAIDLDVDRAVDIGDSFRSLGRAAMESQAPRLKKEAIEAADADVAGSLGAKDDQGLYVRPKPRGGGTIYREALLKASGTVMKNDRLLRAETAFGNILRANPNDLEEASAQIEGYKQGMLRSVDPDVAVELYQDLTREQLQRLNHHAAIIENRQINTTARELGNQLDLIQSRRALLERTYPDKTNPEYKANVQVLEGLSREATGRLMEMGLMTPTGMANLDEELQQKLFPIIQEQQAWDAGGKIPVESIATPEQGQLFERLLANEQLSPEEVAQLPEGLRLTPDQLNQMREFAPTALGALAKRANGRIMQLEEEQRRILRAQEKADKEAAERAEDMADFDQGRITGEFNERNEKRMTKAFLDELGDPANLFNDKGWPAVQRAFLRGNGNPPKGMARMVERALRGPDPSQVLTLVQRVREYGNEEDEGIGYKFMESLGAKERVAIEMLARDADMGVEKSESRSRVHRFLNGEQTDIKGTAIKAHWKGDYKAYAKTRSEVLTREFKLGIRAGYPMLEKTFDDEIDLASGLAESPGEAVALALRRMNQLFGQNDMTTTGLAPTRFNNNGYNHGEMLGALVATGFIKRDPNGYRQTFANGLLKLQPSGVRTGTNKHGIWDLHFYHRDASGLIRPLREPIQVDMDKVTRRIDLARSRNPEAQALKERARERKRRAIQQEMWKSRSTAGAGR